MPLAPPLLGHTLPAPPAARCNTSPPTSLAPAPQVRKAFRADVAAGKTLVVADYGQLELRILAHMANCQSMIRAFEAGEHQKGAGMGGCWGRVAKVWGSRRSGPASSRLPAPADMLQRQGSPLLSTHAALSLLGLPVCPRRRLPLAHRAGHV